MTDSTKQPQESSLQEALSFSWADMAPVRIRPAEFARLLGVSRQTVSKWIEKGIVTLLPDGRLDPVRAIRDVIRKADPATIRARLFREAMRSEQESIAASLRAKDERIAALVAELRESASDSDGWYERLEMFHESINKNASRLRAASTDEEFISLVADAYWESSDDYEEQTTMASVTSNEATSHGEVASADEGSGGASLRLNEQ